MDRGTLVKRTLLLLWLVTLLSPQPARADIAPPEQPPGVNPLPGNESTQVRMVAETVLLDVRPGPSVESLGQARVTADFTMRNLGSETESMPVRFPISSNDGFFNYPEITGLQVTVAGDAASTRRITTPDDNDYPVPWAEFDVTFPPGEDVDIRVAYTLDGTGEYPFVAYRYILETGAGWQETIGSVDLIVRLPYEANPLNVILDEQIGWSMTSAGGVFSGREVRWRYTDLEPTWEHNLQVSLVIPGAWNRVLAERDNVTANPQDGEAWGRLGKLYKEISRLRRGVRGDAGGRELFDLSVAAYEMAVTLLPEDALWHAGFADLLWNYYYWEMFFTEPSDREALLRALRELDRSLAIDPQNPVARAILADMSFAMPEAVQRDGDGYVLVFLTATPADTPVDTPTATPSATPLPATATPRAADTATPSPTPSPTVQSQPRPTATAEPPSAGPSLPLCGALLLAPLGILGMSRRWGRER